MRSDSKTVALLATHVATLFFGATGVIGAVIQSSAEIIVFYRCLFAAVFLFLFFGIGRRRILLSPKMMLLSTISGVLLAAHWLTFFLAVKHGGAALAAISYMTFPMFLVFLEPILLKLALDFRKVALSVFVCFGVYLMAPELSFDNLIIIGIAYGVLSGLCFALLTLLNRTTTKSENPFRINLWQAAFAMLATIPFVVPDILPAMQEDWLWLILLGVVFTLGSHGLFIYGLRHINAHTSGLIVSLEGVYGPLLAWILLDEVITLNMLLGGLVVISGTVMISLMEIRGSAA